MGSSQPVSKLYELMAKLGRVPEFETAENNSSNIRKFTSYVTCLLPPHDDKFSAIGVGLSKKEAKRLAAQEFLRKYCGLSFQNSATNICPINVNPAYHHAILHELCLTYNLSKPQYKEEAANIGSLHSPIFFVECSIERIRVQGEGKTKAAAKLEATTKMIQMLMEKVALREIFESSKLHVLKPDEICLIRSLKMPQLSSPISIIGKRNSDSSLIEMPCAKTVAMPQLHTNTNKIEQIRKHLQQRQLCKENTNSNKHLAVSTLHSNLINLQLDDDCKPNTAKDNSRSLHDSSGHGVIEKIPRNNSQKYTSSKIKQTLDNVERQLYEQVVETLVSRDAPEQKTVLILGHKFEVFFNCSSPYKIFVDTNEFTDQVLDQAITITCLGQILQDFNEHSLCDNEENFNKE